MGRQLTALLAAAIAICAVALIVYQKQQAGPPRGAAAPHLNTGDSLFAELAQQAEKIARVEFAVASGGVKLLRGGDAGWSVESSGGYPADPAKITQLLFELTEIKVADYLTNRPEKYEAFGVAGATAEKGTLRFFDAGGRVLSEIHFGKERQLESAAESLARGGGRYLRKSGDPFVYLAQENSYWLNPELTSWIKAEIVSVPAGDVMSVALDYGSTESFTVDWEGGSPRLAELPEGKQLKTSEMSQLRNALNYLRLEDVLTAASTQALALEFNAAFAAQTKDGTLYRVKAAAANGKHFIALDAEFTSPVLTADDRATTQALADAESKAAAAKNNLAELKAKFSNWVYQIPEFKSGPFTKKLSAVIEDVPPPKTEEEQAADEFTLEPAAEETHDPTMESEPAEAEAAPMDVDDEPTSAALEAGELMLDEAGGDEEVYEQLEEPAEQVPDAAPAAESAETD